MAVFIKNLLGRREQSYSPLTTSSRFDASPASESFLPHPATFGRSSIDSQASSGGAVEDAEKAAATDAATDAATPSHSANFRAHLISNFTIGFSDGLTVPFAVTAGLSALGRPRVVIFGGLSELVAGTISMGMGGYLGAKGEADAYAATLGSVRETVLASTSSSSSSSPSHLSASPAAAQISRTLGSAHIPAHLQPAIVAALLADPAAAIDFLMRFEHALPANAFPRFYALLSGIVLSLGYLAGGIVPLLPYVFMATIEAAFPLSIAVTAFVLAAFGAAKTWAVGETAAWKIARGGLEMLVLGGSAAGAAVGCVRGFS